MRVKINKEDLNELYKLIEVKEANIQIASMLNDLCFSLDQFDFVKESSNLNKEDFSNRAIEEFLDYFELDDTNEDNLYYVDNYLKNAFNYIDIKQYNDNPYKKNIDIGCLETTQKGYVLHYLRYPKYSYFPLNDIEVDEKDYYRETTYLGISKDEYKYLTLSKNKNIWMCITPNEIETMKPHVEKAKGNVITFGLGLGYYAYMASLKNEVKSVTIIEKDDVIINLFSHYILPNFSNKNKIKIIKEDAIKYIKDTRLEGYDYAFFDLWHNAEDGLPLYLEINKLKIIPPTSFWIEESLIAMYRRCLLTVIEESLMGYGDDDYRRSKNAIEKVINEIYFKTKNISFSSYQEIHKFLSKENILKLIRL